MPYGIPWYFFIHLLFSPLVHTYSRHLGGQKWSPELKAFRDSLTPMIS